MKTVPDTILRNALAKRLTAVAEEEANLEAGFLLQYLSDHPSSDLESMVLRRLNGEPLQYVLGEWDFGGYTFTVDRRALIPRPDTELLLETALNVLKGGENVLDLCCGSGCIGIAIAKNRPVSLTSVDISKQAISLTLENAARNGVVLTAYESDLFCSVSGTFDLIVCNPPYLSRKDMEKMDASLRFEPVIALYGGTDGLDFYRRIRERYLEYLNPGGTLLMEIGYNQGESVGEMFKDAHILRDYGNRPRCVAVKREL